MTLGQAHQLLLCAASAFLPCLFGQELTYALSTHEQRAPLVAMGQQSIFDQHTDTLRGYSQEFCRPMCSAHSDRGSAFAEAAKVVVAKTIGRQSPSDFEPPEPPHGPLLQFDRREIGDALVDQAREDARGIVATGHARFQVCAYSLNGGNNRLDVADAFFGGILDRQEFSSANASRLLALIMAVVSPDAVHEGPAVFVLPDGQFPLRVAVGLERILPVVFPVLGPGDYGPVSLRNLDRGACRQRDDQMGIVLLRHLRHLLHGFQGVDEPRDLGGIPAADPALDGPGALTHCCAKSLISGVHVSGGKSSGAQEKHRIADLLFSCHQGPLSAALPCGSDEYRIRPFAATNIGDIPYSRTINYLNKINAFGGASTS